MRNLIFIVSLAMLSIAMPAQDTIVKRNNDHIIAKVLEVNPLDIKFKRYDNLEGPTYTLNKWELNLIVYKNQLVEHYETITEPQPERALAPLGPSDQKTNNQIQAAGNYYYYHSLKLPEKDMLDVAWAKNDKKVRLMVRKTEDDRIYKNLFKITGICIGAAGFLTFTGIGSAFRARAFVSTTGGSYGSRRASLSANRASDRAVGGYMMLGGAALGTCAIIYRVHETRHAHMVVALFNALQ